MRILAIDTSNQTLALSVFEDEKILGLTTLNLKRDHSVTLMPVMNTLMNELLLTPNDIDRIVVAEGPGSYTGLRIGVTTAKTLAYTLKKELVGISSLQTIAANCVGVEKLIVPIFNARRKNVYTGAYQFIDGRLSTVLADRHSSLDDWLEQLKKYSAVYFVGQDLEYFDEAIASSLPQAELCAVPQWQIPNAAVLAQLGTVAEPIKQVHCFTPNYLKLVEAEENWLKDNQNRTEKYVEKK